MRKTLTEIAKIVGGEVVGDAKVVITGLCDIKEGKAGELAFVSNSKYFSFVETTQASAVITPRDFKASGKPVIRTDNPSLAFAKITSLILGEETSHIKGVHKSAVIAEDAKLGKNVAIGPFAVIESNVKIGDDSIIYGGCYIGQGTTIGKGCLIYSKVTIRERVSVGDRVIIHSGAVIGSDGFGFNQVNGKHEKIPQIGTVRIEDDVEIGANVTIDRARLDTTVIGAGTKIDNLVHIAHNVTIGEHCLIVAQVGVAGSVKVGKNVILAGQAGIAPHVTIGDGVVVTSQSGVTKSIPPNTTVFGYPAKPEKIAKKINAHLQRLPKYVNTLHQLQKKVEELETNRKPIKK